MIIISLGFNGIIINTTLKFVVCLKLLACQRNLYVTVAWSIQKELCVSLHGLQISSSVFSWNYLQDANTVIPQQRYQYVALYKFDTKCCSSMWGEGDGDDKCTEQLITNIQCISTFSSDTS